jgi:hypothetical protein
MNRPKSGMYSTSQLIQSIEQVSRKSGRHDGVLQSGCVKSRLLPAAEISAAFDGWNVPGDRRSVGQVNDRIRNVLNWDTCRKLGDSSS